MKIENSVPIFYWPTSIFLVDDDESFLNSFQQSLATVFRVKASTRPMEGINVVNNQSKLIALEDFAKVSDDEDNIDDKINVIKSHLGEIVKQKDDEKKYDIISVVIMDYNLPQNNGLFYIKNIENNLVRKILLTGYAKPQEIIEAFNNGLIHKYISKDDDNVVDNVFHTIMKLQTKYFETWSESLINNNKEIFSLLRNKSFINVFEKIVVRHSIREFYLLDNLGSFLLINKQGKKMIFACKTKTYIESLELFFDSEEESVQGLIKDIFEFKKIPFFRDKGSEAIKPQDWHLYCHEAQTIKNTEILYALISDLKNYNY